MLRLAVLLAAGLAAPAPHPAPARRPRPAPATAAGRPAAPLATAAGRPAAPLATAAGRPAAAPPAGADPLVPVKHYVPGVVVHLRYATRNNFMHRRVYPAGARCLLRRSVVRRLARAEKRLERAGYRLKLWDCYRPRSVQWQMWKLVHTPGLVANPRYGSNHNRGTAVDLTLVHLDGSKVEMPTDLDSFTEAAHARATDVPKAARAHRQLLQRVMRAEGFTTIRMEWWHFNAPHAKGYPIADVPLSSKG